MLVLVIQMKILLNVLLIYGECNRIVDLLKNCLQFELFLWKIVKQKPVLYCEDLEINVLGYFPAYPNTSLRYIKRGLQISSTTAYRISKQVHWKLLNILFVSICYLTIYIIALNFVSG